jgi:hypothetical protein
MHLVNHKVEIQIREILIQFVCKICEVEKVKYKDTVCEYCEVDCNSYVLSRKSLLVLADCGRVLMR